MTAGVFAPGRAVRVVCPATTANLGPGFDALGLALALHNAFTVRVEAAPGLRVTGRGHGAERVPRDPAVNRVALGFLAGARALGRVAPPEAGDPWAALGLAVDMDLAVPPGRGLGSSATASVAGVLAALTLGGLPEAEARARTLELAVALEGHPDNAAPCLLGGLVVAARGEDGRLAVARRAPRDPPAFVVAIPRRLELDTGAMRAVLPAQVARADAVANLGRAALLALALADGEHDLLPAALADRLHEPWRGPRIPGWQAARAAGAAAGAYGVVVSGSGPTLLALCPPARAEAVAVALATALGEAGVDADVREVPVDLAGAHVEPASS